MKCQPAPSRFFPPMAFPRKVEDGALVRELDVIDATCPLVTKVHKEGRRYAAKGYDIVLIGHLGHPEVEGTLGQIPGTVHVLERTTRGRHPQSRR